MIPILIFTNNHNSVLTLLCMDKAVCIPCLPYVLEKALGANPKFIHKPPNWQNGSQRSVLLPTVWAVCTGKPFFTA